MKLLTVLFIFLLIGFASPESYGQTPVISHGQAAIHSDFALIDTQGKKVAAQDFRGKYMLVYFGYTHCPDICPITLATIGETFSALGKKTSDIAPIFITLDPDRDNPKALAKYLTQFDSRIIGLTGSDKAVERAVKNFKSYRTKHKTSGKNYLVDHSGFIYLMDRQGEYAAHFPADISAKELAEKLSQLN